jgi:hypothetical protein
MFNAKRSFVANIFQQLWAVICPLFEHNNLSENFSAEMKTLEIGTRSLMPVAAEADLRTSFNLDSLLPVNN